MEIPPTLRKDAAKETNEASDVCKAIIQDCTSTVRQTHIKEPEPNTVYAFLLLA